MSDTAWIFIKVALALGFGLNTAALLGWVERKQSAVIQDRVGANRASIFGLRILGLFHPIADALKLLTKEDFTPKSVLRPFYDLAPGISLGFALLCLAALPFGGTFSAWGRTWSLQPIESPVGLLYVMAMLSLGVHGVVMAGYASNSNYGLLGGLRGAAQTISYEMCLVLSLASMAFLYGTLDLQQAVLRQGGRIFGILPAWGMFRQPLSFFLFVTAGAALTKRAPFDVPEGESEIVGYHVEYSGMKFGMFMMTDFVESVVISGLAAALFMGGWRIPFYAPAGWPGAVAMAAGFSLKTFLVLFFLMQARWSLPRFRFDQLLDLGWKDLLPLALVNLLLTIGASVPWR